MSPTSSLASRPAGLVGARPALELPAAFQPIAVEAQTDAFARACRAAPRGADHGTLFWSAEPERIRLGLVAEPDQGLPEALLSFYALSLAAGEAVAASLPAGRGLTHAWPGDLIAGERRIGRLRAAVAPCGDRAGVPPWLALGLDLSLPRPGQGREAPVLAARIMRRLLGWQQRRRQEGFAPLRAAWNAGCHALGASGRLWLAGRCHRGRIGGLDEAGRFVIGEARLDLASALPELEWPS